MPDVINAVDNGGGRFKPHPDGQFSAICVDTIDLGERLRTWGDKPKVSRMCALVFMSGEKNEDTGDLHDVHQEFTVSMFAQASLRLFLEAWRGRSYTEEQAKAGVPLHKLVGQPCLISVEHKTSNKGRTYATIKSIMPLPKGMPAPLVDVSAYTRPEFWETRKEGYRAELANFRAQSAPAVDEFEDFPRALDDDSLPF